MIIMSSELLRREHATSPSSKLEVNSQEAGSDVAGHIGPSKPLQSPARPQMGPPIPHKIPEVLSEASRGPGGSIRGPRRPWKWHPRPHRASDITSRGDITWHHDVTLWQCCWVPMIWAPSRRPCFQYCMCYGKVHNNEYTSENNIWKTYNLHQKWLILCSDPGLHPLLPLLFLLFFSLFFSAKRTLHSIKKTYFKTYEEIACNNVYMSQNCIQKCVC